MSRVGGRVRSFSRSRSRSYSRSRSRSPYYRRSPGMSPPRKGKRFLSQRDNPEPSRCLGVFGLNLRTRERDLFDIFNRYGDIEDIQLVFDKFTGDSRGFGFIYFRHLDDARAAKEECHGMEIHSRPIRVDYSVTERAHTPTPGIYMGKRPAPSSRGFARRSDRSPSPRYSRNDRYSRSPSGADRYAYNRRY